MRYHRNAVGILRYIFRLRKLNDQRKSFSSLLDELFASNTNCYLSHKINSSLHEHKFHRLSIQYGRYNVCSCARGNDVKYTFLKPGATNVCTDNAGNNRLWDAFPRIFYLSTSLVTKP